MMEVHWPVLRRTILQLMRMLVCKPFAFLPIYMVSEIHVRIRVDVKQIHKQHSVVRRLELVDVLAMNARILE